MACLCWKQRVGVLVQQSYYIQNQSPLWIRALCFNLGSIRSSQETRLPKARTLMSSMMDQLSSQCTDGATVSSRCYNSTSDAGSVQVQNDFSKVEDEITIQHAKQIFDKAVDSVLPHKMIKRHLLFDHSSNVLTVQGQSYHLRQNVHVVGFGKAILGMAKAVEDVIGEHIVRAVVSVPVGARAALKENGGKSDNMIPVPHSRVQVREGAANNLPDEEAYSAAIEIQDIAQSVGEEDVLLVLISGGGSALLPTPHESIGLPNIMQVSREMAKAGANIKQLNYMRKQLEVLKGGGLAKLAFPAKVIALILSDVIGDPLDFIASGPTVPDTSTPEGCLSIFSQLGIRDIVPKSVVDFLKHGSTSQQDRDESQTTDWTKVQNVIIGSNALACESAIVMSKKLGYLPYILSTELEGEAKNVGSGFAALAKYICMCLNPSLHRTDLTPPTVTSEFMRKFSLESNQLDEIAHLIESCKDEKKSIAVIAGGETTVTVKGSGKGGRNQEMALAASIELDAQFSTIIKGTEENLVLIQTQEKSRIRPFSVAFLSGGTDGQDGPTPAAGGVVTLDFVTHASQSGLNAQQYLDNNDSYSLLKAVNDSHCLLVPGLSGTNVMDIHLLLMRAVV